MRRFLSLVCVGMVGLALACGGDDDGGMGDNADARPPGPDAQLFDAQPPPPNEFSIELDGPAFISITIDPALTNFSELTLELWVNPSNAGGTLMNQKVMFVGGGSPDLYRFLNSGTGPRFDLGMCTNMQFDTVISGWTHLAVTWDGNDGLEGFINGASVVSMTCDPMLATIMTTEGLEFGQNFVGLMDEVRLWSIARTEEEIAAGFMSEEVASPDGLISRWAFPEGEPETVSVSDSGDFELPATLVDGAQWSTDTPF